MITYLVYWSRLWADSLKKEQTVECFWNFNNMFILLVLTQSSVISDKHADLKLLISLKQEALEVGGETTVLRKVSTEKKGERRAQK